jgi:3-hydroxyisobutyrate dehydrogenase
MFLVVHCAALHTVAAMQDLGLAVSAANATRSPLAMGALAHQMYTLMRYHGGAGKDFSAIFEMLNTKPKP